MNRLASFILLCLLLTACGPGGDDFRLKGEIQGMEQSDLLIYSTDNYSPRIDTIHVREGRFAYAGHARGATPFILVFPNALEQVIYANGGASLEYEAVASDLRNYKVKGTKENELLNDFRHDTRKANPIETRDRAETYIRQHTSSPAVLYLYERYFVMDDDADPRKVAELRDVLEREHPDSPLLLTLSKSLEDLDSAQVGQTVNVPDSLLTAPHTLLYFWATWQAVAWSNMGDVRKAAMPYKNLNVVTVSMDVTDEQWVNYMQEKDSSNVRHLRDGLAWDTPLARQFHVHKLPTYILLDRKKKVLARFTEADKLESQLSKQLSKR